MQHCTVCGAAAREGAKFCTSCGARLEETSTETTPAETGPAPADNDLTATLSTAPEADDSAEDTPMQTADTMDTLADEAATPVEHTTYVPSADEPEDPQPPVDDFAASWPDTSADDDEEDVTTYTEPEGGFMSTDRPAGWSVASSSDEELIGEVPARYSTSADTAEDVERSSSWDMSDWASTPAPDVESAEAPVAREEQIDTDPQPPATESIADEGGFDTSAWERLSTNEPEPRSDNADAALRAVQELVDELRYRVDRLSNPPSLASRDIDPDELADDLERWSRAIPNTDDLLNVVQDVRLSPRDLDTITRLADHADDLEILIQHYQSITSSSDVWAHDLRRSRDDTGSS